MTPLLDDLTDILGPQLQGLFDRPTRPEERFGCPVEPEDFALTFYLTSSRAPSPRGKRRPHLRPIS